LRYQSKEVEEEEQTKRAIKKEWNKKPPIEMEDVHVYRLPGKNQIQGIADHLVAFHRLDKINKPQNSNGK
jgi:hypothetical protein